jgi:beta-xylosidase
MYFVAHYIIGQGGTQCIGAATSDKPEGPYTSSAEKPLICQTDEGGSIDPSSFVDEDGKRYILWKNDGNSVGARTWIYIQPTSADGLSLTGSPTQLITADQSWEGVLVEAPTLWKHGGK